MTPITPDDGNGSLLDMLLAALGWRSAASLVSEPGFIRALQRTVARFEAEHGPAPVAVMVEDPAFLALLEAETRGG